jgi:hypothetical protein
MVMYPAEDPMLKELPVVGKIQGTQLHCSPLLLLKKENCCPYRTKAYLTETVFVEALVLINCASKLPHKYKEIENATKQ